MAAQPLTQPLQIFLLLAVCGVVLVVAALRIFAMYIEGTVSPLELTIYIVLTLAALAGTMGYWGTAAGYLLAVAFLGLCLGIPMLQRLADQRLGARLLREDLEECQRLLRFDPLNAAAHSRLGDIFLRMGHQDQAIDKYEQAAALAPKDKAMQRRLQRVIEMKRRQEVPSRFCPRCRTENPSTAVYCRECATPLNAWAELSHSLRRITPVQGLKWGAIVGGAGLLLTGAGILLPRTAAVLVALSLGVAAVLYLHTRPLR